MNRETKSPICDIDKLLHYNDVEKLLHTLIKQLSGIFGKQEGNLIDKGNGLWGVFF